MKTKVLAVALNPSLDRTVSVEHLKPGQELRAREVVTSAGGKAVNVARALRSLGMEAGVWGIAAGAAGRRLESILRSEGLPQKWLWTGGETRTNLTVSEGASGRATRILEAGPVVGKALTQALRADLARQLHSLNVLVLSGSLPPGMASGTWAGLISSARSANVLTALDTSGAALRAGIRARPFLVKPNRDEAEDLCGFRVRTRSGLQKALGHLSRYSNIVLISLGPQGLAVSDTVRMFWARGPVRAQGRTVGCGDAALAGFLAGFLKGEHLEECLRLAVASGTANVGAAVPGGICPREVKAVRAKVKVERL